MASALAWATLLDLPGGTAARNGDNLPPEEGGAPDDRALPKSEWQDGVENLRIAQDRVAYWVENGAQLSPAVARLVKEYSAAQTAA